MKPQPSLLILSAVAAAGALLLGCEGGITQIEPGVSSESELIAAYVDPITPTPGGARPADRGDLDKLPVVDGDPQEREWSAAKPLFVYVSGDQALGGPGFYVELRAIWSDDGRNADSTSTDPLLKSFLYMMVRYADETFDIFPDYWLYARPGQLGLVKSPSPQVNTVSVLRGTGQGMFARNVDYSTDDLPNSVAIGRLNGDERNDLAIGGSASAVSVLFNDPAGDPAPNIIDEKDPNPMLMLPREKGPVHVAVDDVNGDGRMDIVAAWGGTHTVAALLANENGFNNGFDWAIQFSGTGLRPVFVATGDMNGDGKPDLAVANSNSGTVSVLSGNGDGTFSGGTEYGVGERPSSVAIGDLNGDGRPDLAVANNSGTVSVLVGNGDGTFGAKVDYGAGSGSSQVAMRDLNGDGRLDLAVSNQHTNDVSVLLGNGDGTFAPKVDYGAGEGPNSVAIGDLDGDGRADLVVANGSSNTVSVLMGNGDGTFSSPTEHLTGNGPRSVAIGNLNLDNEPDIAVANASSNMCDNVVLRAENWFRQNPDSEEDQVSVMFEIEPASDSRGTFSELGCQIACHSGQFGVVPNGKLDVWTWRAGRTNFQESTVYPDFSRVNEENGVPESSFPVPDPEPAWPAYMEDMFADAGGLQQDAADRTYPPARNGYTGQLYIKNEKVSPVDGGLIPAFITEKVSVVRPGTGGQEEEIEPVNRALPAALALWSPTAQSFDDCDILATSRPRAQTPMWSAGLSGDDTDVMPGYSLFIPSGSAADVRAKGQFRLNPQKRFSVWALEIRRPMVTGPNFRVSRPDDVSLHANSEYTFAIAIFNRSSLIHSGSGPLKLKFAPSLYVRKTGGIQE